MPKRLRRSEREFFSQVAAAAFANPFGEERERWIERLLRGAEANAESRGEALQAVVQSRRDALARRGIRRPDDVESADRDLLVIAALFDVYHRTFPAFDQHVREQIASPEEPLPVPFARETLAALVRAGFTDGEAERYFAIFFQLQRAFFFIDENLVGGSPSMRELRRTLWETVFTHDLLWYDRYLMDRMEDFSTLLLGETGTGKGTAAVAIGRSGPIPFDARRGRFSESFARAFLEIHLAQYPAPLIESELFGHKKGAFTGAIEDHRGVFAHCSRHGSIFLDEIGEVSRDVQIKLLRVLQERVFSPVGSRETQTFRGRVIAATNRTLEELRTENAFRDDFYYRLSTQTIVLPPLRTRLEEDPGELDALLAHTLARLTGSRDAGMVEHVSGILRESVPPRYPWYGNVRELEQAVRRILLTRGWSPERREGARGDPSFLDAVAEGTLSARELVARYCVELHRRSGSIAEVARRTQLDWRTVKRHLASPGS